MAFTDAQVFQIRHYLGFPSVGVDRYMLTSLIETVGEDAQASAEVVSLLTSIAARLTELASSDTIATAGIKSVDKGDVVFQDGADAQGSAIRAAGRQLVWRLSSIFAVEPQRDIFGVGPSVRVMRMG